ncbi:4'-phosphopantetheinyl transferase superfamily [Macleaya cordata]|uniref:holo-[acyl-carrier-protein] synthase n=1 Tax=Macleaya cordata TaxID=56857 RepID=A0A200QRN8_MACCD|nr:4'-phosphopantetheinyl transferase superfamily [Macleaya cordata]
MQIDCFMRKLFCSSSPSVPVALPSRRETHFWYIIPDEVKDASLLNQYLELLTPCEKKTILQMQGDKLQKGALLARALVRTTLARYTDTQVSPSLLKFRKNKFGKPEVEWQHNEKWDPPSLHFNISHTSSLIACGVTVDMPIGIDVEEKERKTRNDSLSFARRYFSLHEVERLHAITDPEVQQHEFIKLWTLKEAYVKALGRGFSAAPFKTFTIRFRSKTKSSSHVPIDSLSEDFEIVVEYPNGSEYGMTNWQFVLFELASSHYATICVENHKIMEGEENHPLKLKVWRTIPFVEDECVSGTDSVVTISGLT